MERLLVETDAPYLSPHPYRGKRNEPARVTLVAEQIAELKAYLMKKCANKQLKCRKLFNLNYKVKVKDHRHKCKRCYIRLICYGSFSLFKLKYRVCAIRAIEMVSALKLRIVGRRFK